MVRIGLATYLMLVTLAGPGFCPCWFAQVLAQIAHPAQAKPSQRASRLPCCCQPTTGEKAPAKPGPLDCPFCPGRECPFLKLQAQALVSADSELGAQLQAHRTPAGLADILPFLPAAAWLSGYGIPLIPSSAAVWPFLTAQEILRFLCISRC